MKRTKDLAEMATKRIVRRPEAFLQGMFRALVDDLAPIINDVALPFPFTDEERALIAACVKKLTWASYSALSSAFEPRRMLKCCKGQIYEAQCFFARYLLGSLLKKYPFKDATLDPQGAAIRTFKKYERVCGLYNKENHRSIMELSCRTFVYNGIIEELRQDILRCIGERPNVNRIYDDARHGPGTAVGNYENGKVTSFYKFAILPYSVTPGCYDHAWECISSDPRWIGAIDDAYRRTTGNLYRPVTIGTLKEFTLQIEECSRITTVPKKSDTDRTIAIEPLMNVYLQLGVDMSIRSSLKKWGIDLDSQVRNQELARDAVKLNLATLDLSGASDTVTTKICELLLPPEWYSLLLDLRTPRGVLPDGSVVEFEKLSSMGNGYTFAIESLIFGAITRAAVRRTCAERVYAVYGDDIILPSKSRAYVIDLLNLFGFSVNLDKSFWEGPFRESCGKDFYNGIPVRPIFLKRRVRNHQDLFFCHNSFFALREEIPREWNIRFFHTLSFIRARMSVEITDVLFGPRSETLDAYLFIYNRRLTRNKYGQLCVWYLRVKPKIFNCRSGAFFFRKLMVKLGPKRKISPWEKQVNGSSAFDIVRRDAVTFTVTSRVAWKTGCRSSHLSLKQFI